MRSFSFLLLLQLAALVAAQIVTLPECVTTCLHNTIPQCSGLKCYCLALNSTSLIAVSTCYHSLCDSTTDQPFNVFIADVGPLCFQVDAPIDRAQINSAAAAESSTTFSTYLSLSDGPSNTTSTSAAGGSATTATPATTTFAPPATQTATFEASSRNRFGVLAPAPTSASVSSAISAGAATRGLDRRGGALAGMVVTVAGIVLQFAG